MVAMTGLFGKKKPMFGRPDIRFPENGTPPINGDPQHSPVSMSTQPMGAMPVNNPKPGLGTRLFGQGWEDKAFALGGIMQGDSTGVYMMKREEQAQRDAAAAAQQAELQRAQELADFEYRKRFEWENAPEPNNDTVRDFEWYQGLSEEEKRAYHQMRPQMVQIDNGDGTKTIMPYNPYGNSGAPQQGQLPTFTDEDWEAAGSNAGGNFRR